MQTVKEWIDAQYRAGSFGLHVDMTDRHAWIVAPVSRTRDADTLSESNFRVALERLGGESETVEVHRMGHFACGWYELIFTDPCHAPELEEMTEKLEEYPILSEDDLSALEFDRACDTWAGMSYAERKEYYMAHAYGPRDAKTAGKMARRKSLPDVETYHLAE